MLVFKLFNLFYMLLVNFFYFVFIFRYELFHLILKFSCFFFQNSFQFFHLICRIIFEAI